jgi:hypothetical protein
MCRGRHQVAWREDAPGRGHPTTYGDRLVARVIGVSLGQPPRRAADPERTRAQRVARQGYSR